MGDIHGCLEPFEALIEAIRKDDAARGEAETELILLGDLIDRGPDSAAVVDRAIGWEADWASLEVLLGNHEASMCAVLDGDLRWLDSWLTYGGIETLLSYGVDGEAIAGGEPEWIAEAAREAVPRAHRDWLAERPFHLSRGDYLFVHAGIRPGVPIGEQSPQDLLWIREEFLRSRADHGATVVHGHSIRETIDERPNRIGIDTGAFMSGTLTAVGLEGRERWFLQS
ncbi:MAG: metallophosphoesterase [Parasphingopyxis sp.]